MDVQITERDFRAIAIIARFGDTKNRSVHTNFPEEQMRYSEKDRKEEERRRR